MKNKKSSFQIGNQFNGYGDKIYLKAEPVEILPISQADIKLMPDYSQFTLYATGSNPIVLNPKNINLTVNSMLGAVPALSQVTLIKEILLIIMLQPADLRMLLILLLEIRITQMKKKRC